MIIGCHTAPPSSKTIIILPELKSHALYSREFTLSETNQVDEQARIRLVGLAPDGVVSIRSFQSGSLLESNTNGYFPSRDFGSQGLHILNINYSDKSVTFEQKWCN